MTDYTHCLVFSSMSWWECVAEGIQEAKERQRKSSFLEGTSSMTWNLSLRPPSQRGLYLLGHIQATWHRGKKLLAQTFVWTVISIQISFLMDVLWVGYCSVPPPASLCLFLIFWDWVPLCSPDWHGTHSGPPASSSTVLGLEVKIPIPRQTSLPLSLCVSSVISACDQPLHWLWDIYLCVTAMAQSWFMKHLCESYLFTEKSQLFSL